MTLPALPPGEFDRLVRDLRRREGRCHVCGWFLSSWFWYGTCRCGK